MILEISEFNQDSFIQAILKDGYCLVKNVLDHEMINRLKDQSLEAINSEAAFHGTTKYKHYGIVQSCPMYGGAFLDVLENKNLMNPFDSIIGEGSIIWSYITTCMPPNGDNFSSRIHVDRPWLFENHCECLAGLILLDDFTQQNGGTWLLPGSHNNFEPPSEEFFYKNAIQIEAPAGSVLYFNLRLWHAGGKNQTDKWRHALAIGVVRPYIKQKFDLPNMLKYYGIDDSNLSDYVKLKLGFFSIAPKSLEEFYGVNATRTYTQESEWSVAERLGRRI